MAVTDDLPGGALSGAVAATHRDDPSDLEAIYEHHHRMVTWLVRGHVPEHAVDDVVQDVFVAIHRRLAQAPNGERLGPWVVGVTRSVCHTHRRSDARRRARLRRLIDRSPEFDAEARLDDRAALRRVARCLQTIEPQQRETFVLIELHGLTVPQAAEALGVKLNTVYSRLRLARRKLAHAIAEPRETVASARQAGRPSPRHTRRTWALIAARVGLGSGPIATPIAGADHGWLGIVAGAGVAGILALGAWDPGPATPAGISATAIPPGESGVDESGVDESGERVRSGAAPVQTVTRPSPPAQSTSAATPAAQTPPLRRARAVSSEPPPNPDRPAGSSLGAEARLLRQVVLRLDAGDPSEAAQYLAEHERRFADGILRIEREQLAARLARIRRATMTDAGPGGAR